MERSTLRNLSLIALLSLTLLALPVVARADGAIGFLDGTTSTINAGSQFSWMEPGGGDWDGIEPAAGVVHVTPSFLLPRNITVVSSRTATSLILIFTIDDRTHTKPPAGLDLSIGDKIIIQIDPDNSGHVAGSTVLSVGPRNNIATDYRFEIVINSDDLVSSQTGFRLPEDFGDGFGIGWGRTTDTDGDPDTSFATLVSAPLRYQVTATIPLSLIGGPRTDIGIAFAVINDLGHTASDGTHDATGSEFPMSMGLDTLVNDLGLVDSEQASGSWLNPSRWGVGFFSVAPQNVHFNNSPSFAWSDSIKLSKCNENDWVPIPNSGSWTNQLDLHPRWYTYNESDPCRMRIWFNVFKSQPGAVTKRFVIFWGRPGISPRNWIFVTFTDPVVLTLPETRSFFTWNDVPPVDFSGHPCLRIYILPDELVPAFDTEAEFRAITTGEQLDAMELAYSLQPNSEEQSAQMNFTATEEETPSCPPDPPCACLDQPNDLNAGFGGSDSVQFLRAGYDASGGAEPITNAAPKPQTQSQNNDTIRIFVEGFGVPARGLSTKPYTYLERLGGIGWAVDNADLIKLQRKDLRFDITNPPLMQRDFTGATPVQIRSPRRDIFLAVNVISSQGTPLPIIIARPPNPTLDPGETVRGVITLAPGGGTAPVDPGFRRWGLSLHAGVSVPHGGFNSAFNPGQNLAIDLEYRLNRTVSLEGIYGFHRFNGDTFGDLNVHQLSFNGKVYGRGEIVRPFFNFGGGAYNFGSGAATRGGLNVGGGVQFDVTPTVAVEGVYNLHNVFTSGSSTRFSGLQGGVRFRF